jgi:hypothetical protein
MGWSKIATIGTVGFLFAGSAIAHAAPVASTPAGAGVVPATAPPGYTVVNSGSLLAPNSHQTYGAVTCPLGTKIYGGTVVPHNSGLTVRGLVPLADGSGWATWINNPNTYDASFSLDAICAKKPRRGYKVIAASVSVPAGSPGTVQATCPGTSKVLGGGGVMNSRSLSADLNSSFPGSLTSWEAKGNNGTGAAVDLTAWAVCGKRVKGLSQVRGAGDNEYNFAHDLVSCPVGEVALSGGPQTSGGVAGDISVHLERSALFEGSTDTWSVFETSDGVQSIVLRAWAVCAGTP